MSSATTPPTTRERLLYEAMRLFAREGMNAVSLRRVVAAAGAANLSALHYHFGNRESVVEEVTSMLQSLLEPRCCARLEALEGRPYTVREVMEAAFGPMIEMLSEPELGRDAVCFIGRLGWDFAEKGQRLSAQLHQRILHLALERLHALMPEVDLETLQFRLILSMNTVYYGISYRSYLRRSPFGPMAIGERGNEERERKEFMDYLEAGIRNPCDP
jgi:AcrR family transcriptional regulator